VAIDLVGPCNETLEGNKYILTMLDLFSRWTVAVPIPSKHPAVIAHAIYKNLITKLCIPERIYSDKGSEFVNKGLKAMCRRWSINQIHTSGWQPQANPVERVHRWLNSSMTTLQERFGSEWDTYVDAVIFSYNVSTNDSTGFSPYKLLYGRDPRLPDDIMLGMALDGYATETEYHIETSRRMASAYQHVLKTQLEAALRNQLAREDFHNNVTGYMYTPGTLVWTVTRKRSLNNIVVNLLANMYMFRAAYGSKSLQINQFKNIRPVHTFGGLIQKICSALLDQPGRQTEKTNKAVPPS